VFSDQYVTRAAGLVVTLAALLACQCGFAADSAPPPARTKTMTVLSNGAEVQSGTTRVRIIAISDDVLRVRIAPSGILAEDASWAVPAEQRQRSIRVEAVKGAEGATNLSFRTASLAVRIDADPLRLIVTDLAGRVITADTPLHALSAEGNAFTLRKLIPGTEHYFGMGDKAGALDHRGQALTNWNTDAFGYQESTDPLYKSIPFFVAAGGAGGSYGIFLDNTWRSWFDFGRRDAQTLEFGAAGGSIDYYIVYGPSTRAVVQRYAELTGKPPLAPLWSLGFQQSRWSYMSADDVSNVARTLRAEHIPADVIWLDIDYQDRNRPFTINRQTFPDLPGLTASLRKQGIRTVAITDLHIAAAPDQGYAPYDSGVAGDHFLKKPDGSLYLGEVWPGPAVFPEFTQPRTRDWWATLFREFVDAGVAGFWNDMNEPAIFLTPSRTMPLDVQHRIAETGFQVRTADHAEIHNVYGMLNSRATFEGLEQLQPTERPFVMTRASFAGGQKYAVTWTGDNSSTWNHLSLAIRQMLNLGMSGFAYSGADVGGFKGAPSAELLTKWIEVAAFTPIFRIHSIKGSPRREPWLDGEKHTAIRRRFIEARYRLMPYLYSLADENARTGAPLMRPLFYEFPEALEASCEQPNLFLLGASLLIAPPPNFESPADYSVCLPAGGWYEYWTGKKVATTHVQVKPKWDQLPVFVRAGTVLPSQPLVQSTADTPQGPLTLDVYPGHDCQGVIYLDDGHSTAYREGAFLRQTVRCAETADGIDVHFERREGNFQPWWHQIEVRVHGFGGGVASLNGKALPGRKASKSGTFALSIGDQPGPAKLSFAHPRVSSQPP
jgi:alpha-glucosidase